MATPQIGPRHSTFDVPDDIAPPAWCHRSLNPSHPMVVLPELTLEAVANALTFESVGKVEVFETAIREITLSSDVLKAWFAFQMACRTIEVERTMSGWEAIKRTIDTNSMKWRAHYRTKAGLPLSKDELKRMKMPELHARAVFVLFRKFQDRSASLLCYHSYYRTDETKLYLAAHVLKFLRQYTMPESTYTTHRPEILAEQSLWLRKESARIGLACEEYVREGAESWDPRSLLENEQLAPDSALQAQNVPKKLPGRQQSDGPASSLDIDRRKATNNTTSPRGSSLPRRQEIREDSINSRLPNEQRKALDASTAPTTLKPGRLPQGLNKQANLTTAAEQRTDQIVVVDSTDLLPSKQTHSNHPILGLAAFTGELSDRDAEISGHLFQLIRLDYHSINFIEKLNAIFAPLKQLTTEEWHAVQEKKRKFAEHQVLELESLVDDLEKADAEDARAMLRLIRRNHKAGADFATPLNNLFDPMKQRNKEQRTRLAPLWKVLEEIDEEAKRQTSTTTAKSAKGTLEGSDAAHKRKRSHDTESG